MTGFFLPVPAVRGGATEKIWHGLAKLFAAQGHAVTFVSRGWPGLARTEVADGIRHVRLPGFEHTRSLILNLLLDFAWGLRVAWALPKGDVVICNTVTLPIWLPIARRSVGRVAVMMGRRPKGQVPFYRGVARIYTPSTFVAEQIARGWASQRTRVIGNPIDWPLLARSGGRTGSPVVIGFIGRLHPEKGIELLIRAACRLAARADLPEWRLRIAGPAGVPEGGGGEDWLGPLRERAREGLGGRVDWLPAEFDPERLARLYGGMDIFCYPSLAEKGETFGVAAAEGMAAGCATVVSSLACFRDLVTDGDTGLVFDHGAPDPEGALADCLGRLVADRSFRMTLSARGQEHARRFDYPEVARNILDDLSVLSGARPEKPT